MYCLDANVWVYFLDEGLPEHEAVVDSVSPILSDEPVFTTTVLQMEVVHYLTNQLADSERVVERFLSIENCTVADLTTEDVRTGAGLLAEYDEVGIGGRDGTGRCWRRWTGTTSRGCGPTTAGWSRWGSDSTGWT
jgi:predicted nucleic acid-binding protein